MSVLHTSDAGLADLVLREYPGVLTGAQMQKLRGARGPEYMFALPDDPTLRRFLAESGASSDAFKLVPSENN